MLKRPVGATFIAVYYAHLPLDPIFIIFTRRKIKELHFILSSVEQRKDHKMYWTWLEYIELHDQIESLIFHSR